MQIQVLFFAKVREQLNNTTELSIHLDDSSPSPTIQTLVDLLSKKGEQWETTLTNQSIKISVNQELATLATALHDNAEVAFFPPITGG